MTAGARGNPSEGHGDRTGELIVGMLGDEEVPQPERRRRLGALAGALGGAASLGRRRLVEEMLRIGPRIPVRDAEKLRAQYPGASTEEIARRLVDTAANATTAVGAAAGALATVKLAAPPLWLSLPAQIAAETLVVAAIEVKLVAELHELYGFPARGGTAQRAVAYVLAWSNRRGVDPLDPRTLTLVVGSAARRQLGQRLVGRAGRNLSALAPMFAGAVAAGALNRRETRKLGRELHDHLRRRAVEQRHGWHD